MKTTITIYEICIQFSHNYVKPTLQVFIALDPNDTITQNVFL